MSVPGATSAASAAAASPTIAHFEIGATIPAASSSASSAATSSFVIVAAASVNTNTATKPLSKSALKRLEKQCMVDAKQAAKQEKQKKNEQKKTEVPPPVLVEDATLPQAKSITISEVQQYVSQRVKVHGWIHFFHRIGQLLFINLRDGSGTSPALLPAVLSPPNSMSFEAKQLQREACVRLYGTLRLDERALGGIELVVDFWEQIGASHYEIESSYCASDQLSLSDHNRHLHIRALGEVAMLKVRSALCHCIRSYLIDGVAPPTMEAQAAASSSASSSAAAAASSKAASTAHLLSTCGGGFIEVTCPTIIPQPMQVAASSVSNAVLANVQYHRYIAISNYYKNVVSEEEEDEKKEDEKSERKDADMYEQQKRCRENTLVYLTQTTDTHHYLETCLPALNRVFSFTTSFNCEDRQWRGLNEMTYVGMEMNIPTGGLDVLLTAIEDFFVEIVEKLMQSPYGDIILKHNPAFLPPRRPFLRTTQADAEVFYRENHLDSEFYFYNQYGQRKLAEHVGQPLFMLRSPVNRPWTYAKCHDAPHLLESVDLLLPGFGSILSCGGMRETSYDALMNGFASANINPTPFYWYTDLRKFGSTPHGGFSVCIEFMLMWLLNKERPRHVVLYRREEHVRQP